MVIVAILIASFTLTYSAPLPPTTDFDAATSLTIFGRDLPGCVGVVARYRTIQDIVSSCLATIFACTWVAVHPNVPRPKDSRWKKFWQRVLVMVYAILAPEFVIAWALRQWRGAVRHAAEYNQKFYGVPPPSSYLRWYIKSCFHQDENPGLWTITHGFLLEMHGLADDSGELVYTVDEILEPLDLPEDEISDKSKGDFLTKLLVILQTTWFIFQCLARWITHLPVTELEVVTLAFALLNIGTYSLWWNKPQGMDLAIRMDRYRKPKQNSWEKRETTGTDVEYTTPGTPLKDRPEHDMDDSELGDRPNQRSGFPGRAAKALNQLVCRLNALMNTVTMTLHRRRLRSLTFEGGTKIVMRPFWPLFAMVLGSDVGECQHIFYSSRVDFTTVPSAVLISTVFSGLHLIPLWSSSFPPSPQKSLWTISAMFITLHPIPTLLSCVFTDDGVLEVVCFILMLGLLVLYFAARMILVTLAFTTLCDLPPDAFRNIPWTTFLPHV